MCRRSRDAEWSDGVGNSSGLHARQIDACRTSSRATAPQWNGKRHGAPLRPQDRLRTWTTSRWYHYYFYAPTVGKGKRCFCPSVRLSVCPSVAYIANNSRTQRPKFGRNVPHLRCDSHTSFKVKRSKVRVRGGRGHTVSAETGGHTACLPVRLILQEAMLSQRGRAMLRVRQWLASTVQYLERSLLLLVTSASDLPMHSLAYSRPCCRGYDKHGPLMRGGLRGGIIIRTR